MRKLYIFFISVLFFIIQYKTTFANFNKNIIILNNANKVYPLDLSLEILEDKTKKLNFNQIITNYSSQFVESKDSSHNYGFTNSVYWIKFTLHSKSMQINRWILEMDFPLMDKISLFVPDSQNNYTEKKYGYSIPFAKRDIKHRNFLFNLYIKNEQTKTYFLRFESADRIEFPLTIYSPVKFQEKDHFEQLILGIYYGIIIALILYNFFLFISTKDRSYIYYILFLIGFAFYQLTQNGIAYCYLWPDFISNHYIHIIDTIILVLIIEFLKTYLRADIYSPLIYKIFIGLQIVFPLSLLLSFIISYAASIIIVLTLIIITAIVGVSMCFVCIKKNYRPAKYVIVAWTAFVTGIFIFIGKVYGILPNNYFTHYSIQIGSACEAILLSLGLGDRINILREEKNKIQREALETQTYMAESFSRFVPKEFLRFLNRKNITDVGLGDQIMREMTILFSDIRSFTKLSEKLSPQENIDFINSFLTSISPIIQKNNGFIDKFIGDAIMVLFPGPPDDAVKAALDMYKQVTKLNSLRRFNDNAPIKIGIGIHTGMLMLGTIGEQNRIETTVISDAVNTTARLEGLNKRLKSDIIISKTSFEKLQHPENFKYKKIKEIKIRGKENPISIVQILI